jgi:hypothetical protein
MADKIQTDFENFHNSNPEVYKLFDRFTKQMIEAGHTTGAGKLVTERIRWETSVMTVGEPVKINNNYTSRYARLWEERNPQYEGFFRKRVLHTTSANSFGKLEPQY